MDRRACSMDGWGIHPSTSRVQHIQDFISSVSVALVPYYFHPIRGLSRVSVTRSTSTYVQRSMGRLSTSCVRYVAFSIFNNNDTHNGATQTRSAGCLLTYSTSHYWSQRRIFSNCLILGSD